MDRIADDDAVATTPVGANALAAVQPAVHQLSSLAALRTPPGGAHSEGRDGGIAAPSTGRT